MKNTQSKTKSIKMGNNLEQRIILDRKNIHRILGQKK